MKTSSANPFDTTSRQQKAGAVDCAGFSILAAEPGYCAGAGVSTGDGVADGTLPSAGASAGAGTSVPTVGVNSEPSSSVMLGAVVSSMPNPSSAGSLLTGAVSGAAVGWIGAARLAAASGRVPSDPK